MSKPIIEVKGISKRYQLGGIGATRLRDDLERVWDQVTGRAPKKDGKEFWALRDVTFEVQPGEIVGIIGRNGAGKSTLLKILSRITEPTSGEIVMRGRVASLLEVGTGFNGDLTGRENIFLNGAILGMTKAEIRSKLDEIIAFAEIEKFIDTPVKRYSSGMYVRLAFAVAAHLEPEILIVDEVLAVGDADFQKKCIGKMQQVSSAGRTILFVSHNIDAISKLCVKGVLLEGGTVKTAGKINSVIREYIEADITLRSRFSIKPPDASDAPVRATRLVIESLDGNEINGFPAGAEWRIRVSIEVVRRTDSIVTAVGLVTSLGLPVWTAWDLPRDLSPGNYDVVFSNEDVFLCSGIFNIAVGLTVSQRSVHYVPEAGRLMISEVSEVAAAMKSNGDCGFIVNPMKTTIEPSA